MVPVNLRPLDEAWQLGNRFGLAPLVLPIGIENPIERVYAVRARMTELKTSYQPLLAFAVLAVAGLMVKPVQDAMLGLFCEEGDRGDDQRPRAGGAAEVLRLDAAADDVLGAGVGRHRRRASASSAMAAACSSGSSPTRRCARIRRRSSTASSPSSRSCCC